MTGNPFLRPEEEALTQRFLADQYVVLPVEELGPAQRIQARAAELAAAHLGLALPDDAEAFLNDVHAHVDAPRLNALRLAVIQGLNAEPWLRPAYFATARSAVETIVGNELAMQRRINLSVQLPADQSSLLPIHADVWNGDSPFEVVLWLPLVDCARTKSMFIVPPAANAHWQERLAEFAGQGGEALYEAVKGDAVFLDVPFGHALLFSQNLMHGNRVNDEAATRWSMNCRFKSVLSPYADKRLGEFFEPISIRPATRLGAAYRMPGGFHE
jgi:sporadic carbohydrate cluster 2OG-Fe(II) oxygenase